MRYIAPTRETVDHSVFDLMPLAAWRDYAPWLCTTQWPSIAMLNACWPDDIGERFEAQTPTLLTDHLHYEQRIANRGLIATREGNWHDLFNALIWLRYTRVKRALNTRQVSEIARMGTKVRSRAQYALTHFDEAGVMVSLRDPTLLDMWDAHDWHGLFWKRRDAWQDGSIRVELFGHALLELALTPGKLLVGKALVRLVGADMAQSVPERFADAIDNGIALNDPLELRPLPLSGIPGWHPLNETEAFHLDAVCYQPIRSGRHYPPPLTDG